MFQWFQSFQSLQRFKPFKTFKPFKSFSKFKGKRGQRRFSVQTSGGGGTIERPVSVSTMEPSAGQYIKQTVHFG